MPPQEAESNGIEQVPLKLGDEFKAIRHLARAQSNPLKSIAELVENSIDARAGHCWIERSLGKSEYLRVSDDGKGIMIDDGVPNFRAVLQRIGDSAKTRLDQEEREGVKGEFGIGLLGFYALGEKLVLTSKSRYANGSTTKTYKMMIVRDIENAQCWKNPEPVEREMAGVDVTIESLSSPVRKYPARKIVDYLSTELRGRLATSRLLLTFRDAGSDPVPIRPRQYQGAKFSKTRVDTKFGPLLLDLYLCPPEGERDVKVSVGVKGTKVYDRIDSIPPFGTGPWISGKVQGFIDYPAAKITPNRTELEPDKFFDELVVQLQKLAPLVRKEIAEIERVNAEKQDRAIIEEIRQVFQRAIEDLPIGHYDLFETRGTHGAIGGAGRGLTLVEPPSGNKHEEEPPSILALSVVEVQPRSAEVLRGEQKVFRVVPLDANGREVTRDLSFEWETRGGMGSVDEFGAKGIFTAGSRLGEGRVIARVRQGEIEKSAEAIVYVVEHKAKRQKSPKHQPGIPNLEPVQARTEVWHSHYVPNRNVIEYNSAHNDYLQVRRDIRAKELYLSTLVAKELVKFNVDQSYFPPSEALERMVEVVSSVQRNLRELR